MANLDSAPGNHTVLMYITSKLIDFHVAPFCGFGISERGEGPRIAIIVSTTCTPGGSKCPKYQAVRKHRTQDICGSILKLPGNKICILDTKLVFS